MQSAKANIFGSDTSFRNYVLVADVATRPDQISMNHTLSTDNDNGLIGQNVYKNVNFDF